MRLSDDSPRCSLFLAALLACWPAAGAPVIPPAGFERGLGAWRVVRGDARIDDSVAHRGKRSLRLRGPARVETDFLDLGAACWELSFWMKTENVVRGPRPWRRAGAQVTLFDAQRRPVGKGHFDIGLTLGSTPWTLHRRVIYFPPKRGVRYIRLALMNWNCQGTTWFDDVSLTTAPIPEPYVKVPPLREVENRPPRIWRLPKVRPAARRAAAARDDAAGALRVTAFRIEAPEPLTKDWAEDGVDIDRGYMTRRVRRRKGGPGPDGLRLELYEETFRGSPIRSRFPRLWMANNETVSRARYVFSLSGMPARVRWFRGNRLVVSGPGAPARLDKTTTKPFIILSNAADDAGLVLFHPIPAEIRRWHIEDYLVEREVPVQATVRRTDAGAELVYDFRALRAGAGGFCHSFDFYVFAMPWRGRLRDALAEFQLGRVDLMRNAAPFSRREPRGYWQPFMSNAVGARLSRMARYFPREFASWMNSSRWDYGHPGGHGWGCTTATMKGVRVNGNARRALARDYAWRMLTFFVTAAGPTGAPPNCYTWRAMAARCSPVAEHYQAVFCQYWEYRLPEFRAWLRESRLLTPGEKNRIYAELQRARRVYDPANADTTWSFPTPNGGLWFEYLDKPHGMRRWVINTHTTSVGNVGNFALLARDMGRDADYAFWRGLFRRGVDGLLYVLGRKDMWTDYDPNELRYALPPDGGPRGYHRYMVTCWMRNVAALDMEMGDYRLRELVDYWKRMARARYVRAADRASISKALAAAAARLER